MKDTETLVLTKSQSFWHYFIVLFFLVMPVLTTIDVFKYYISHTYSSLRPIEELMFAGYIWILPAIIFYLVQKRRLKFHSIQIQVSPSQFIEIVNRTAKELEWTIEIKTGDTLIAKSGFSWRSWGEQITIIRCDNKLLFNSICDPDNKPSVASYGMNKLNRKTFERFAIENHSKIFQ